ncbi:MAG: hypothetical protein KGI23_01835 [Patescibacteria group bacterium]|nr:hypothetical protein [Patescibacteria group bacterium]
MFDLMKWKQSYPAAVPVLLEHLPSVQDMGIKEGIVRALTVKEARGKAGSALVAEFRAVPPSPNANIGLKWAIANALSVVSTDAIFGDIVALVKDKQHGKSREMLAVALGNMRNPAAVDVLIELLNDDEVAGHALMALRRLKAHKALAYIERFVSHPKSWIRSETLKTIKDLQRLAKSESRSTNR